jgi:hypothetical protein
MSVERSDRLIYLKATGPLASPTVTLVVVSIGRFHVLSSARGGGGACRTLPSPDADRG